MRILQDFLAHYFRIRCPLKTYSIWDNIGSPRFASGLRSKNAGGPHTPRGDRKACFSGSEAARRSKKTIDNRFPLSVTEPKREGVWEYWRSPSKSYMIHIKPRKRFGFRFVFSMNCPRQSVGDNSLCLGYVFILPRSNMNNQYPS